MTPFSFPLFGREKEEKRRRENGPFRLAVARIALHLHDIGTSPSDISFSLSMHLSPLSVS